MEKKIIINHNRMAGVITLLSILITALLVITPVNAIAQCKKLSF